MILVLALNFYSTIVIPMDNFDACRKAALAILEKEHYNAYCVNKNTGDVKEIKQEKPNA